MECQKLEENKCRICLEEDVVLDWNDYLHENMTYKDCYYKYTQLDCFDGDNLYLPTMLCGNCSSSLKKIDGFISKAIATHNLLQEHLALEMAIKADNERDVKPSFETVLISESDIKPDIENRPITEDKSEEYLEEENDFQSSAEDSATSVKQPSTKRKRKLIKRENKDNNETSSNELQSSEIRKKNYHCSKPWEIPTCCSICSKVLQSKYKAIAHEKTHLKNRERSETCRECGMQFYRRDSLKAHMQTHVKNREKTKKCEFCDKAFYYTGALNIHRRIHLGQMIKCSLCTKEFYRQIDLEHHMVSHSVTRIDGELKTKKKYFVCCEFCGDNVRSVYYKSHAAKHMNEPLAKCAICNKEFFSRDSCISHLKKFHKKGTGERSEFVISYETSRYSNLFLQQNVGKIFTKE